MKKSIFHALKYSGETLFSAKFRNIVGSSLILSFSFTLLVSISLIIWGYITYALVGESGYTEDTSIFGLLGFPVFLLFLMTLSILVQ